jgi:ADP-heptose:LPS heptosyltransferase
MLKAQVVGASVHRAFAARGSDCTVAQRLKILVARPGAIGDVCMLMPIAKALSRDFEVHWLIRDTRKPIVQRFPDIGCRLIGVEIAADTKAPFTPDTVRRLADEKYDCLLDFCHWPAVTWLAEQLTEIPIRAVTVDPPQDALLDIAVDPERQGRAFNRLVSVPSALHQIDKWCLLVRAALGVDVQPDWPLPARPLPESGRPLTVFLQPHAAKPEKIWPADRFAAVIAQIARRRKVHCVINRAHGSIVRALRWRLLFSAAAVDVLPLDASFRALHEALEGADIAFGCDSGPIHFASLMGVPTLVIYGRYPAAEFAPRWRSTAISPPDPGMPATEIPKERVTKALEHMLGEIACPASA